MEIWTRHLCGCARVLWLIAGALAALVARSALSEPALLTPNTTLVLVSGVQGDLESETAYREQLKQALDVARDSTNVSRVFVLCDNPEASGFAGSERVTAAKADRSHFLSLADTLKAQTNPIVFMIWGHGGRQGATNVFHVRGPRLTPADFSQLATSLHAMSSSWVLYFRGSGAFAATLAGPNRQILSSDADSGFNSDPIGLPLFLKALRDEPEGTFEFLAGKVGELTTAWYQERHLARVEEPVLWLGKEKPRLLAKAEEASTFASVSDSPAKTNATNSAPSSSTEKPTVPAAFKDVERVSPSEFPDDDAVILRRSVSYTIAANPALATEHEEFVQILTQEGKRHADFDLSFSPPAEDLAILDCEILSPEGNLARLNPDAMHESGEKELGDYRSAHRKFFSLPGAVPGAVLHLHYRTSWKEFPQPYVSLKIPLAGELPIVSSTIKVTVPREAAFHWAVEKIEAADPQIERTDYGVTYGWKFAKQAAESHDGLSPPNLTPRLMVSLFPDWREFADWYARICRLADSTTPEIEQQAAELTKNARNDREKVLAIYNFVTGLRYVAVPLGVNSFRPHSAAGVLKNRYGDCKDKANLFNALLRTVHIHADLVLVPRFSQAYASVPGFAFNHAISHVSLSGEYLWVDTTDDTCRFGMLPPGDYGRNVLVVAPGTNQLVQLPLARPQDHTLKIQCRVLATNAAKVSASASVSTEPGLAATISATASGFPDYALRSAARSSKGRRDSLPLLESAFTVVTGSFALESQSHSSVANLDEAFVWHAEGQVLGTAGALASGDLVIRPPAWVPKDWLAALHHRRDPLFLNEGYPLRMDQEFELLLPPTNLVPKVPSPSENNDGPLRWQLRWSKADDTHLLCALHTELQTSELSLGETQKFQEQVGRLLEELAQPVVVSVGK